MIIFVTVIGLLIAWCGAVIYIRFRPSSPDGPLNAPLELDMGTPVEVHPVVHGRLYHVVTYAAPVVVGVGVAAMFVVTLAPLVHG